MPPDLLSAQEAIGLALLAGLWGWYLVEGWEQLKRKSNR